MSLLCSVFFMPFLGLNYWFKWFFSLMGFVFLSDYCLLLW
uniref:Uncharacterized protein n=1 Tax=Rhizophora mucronata TaxID=61149 RepID=A0A2P2Q273_RHIMU